MPFRNESLLGINSECRILIVSSLFVAQLVGASYLNPVIEFRCTDVFVM